MDGSVKRFACTGCGKCCNRAPEMELGEAAALADVFVFRLMFRLYWLPDRLQDFSALARAGPNASAIFYGRKRRLGEFAARKWSLKIRRDGKPVPYTKYLSLSALALDTSPGVCGALSDTQCGIYERRPLSCRSVPFHYSRAESEAGADLDTFVSTPGYRCDTSNNANVVLEDGRIVAPEIGAARAAAISIARADRPWTEAISRRLRTGSPSSPGLPTLQEIEDNAAFAATTVSMRLAWRIAADAGLITPVECDRLVEVQLEAIDQALELCSCSPDVRETLREMKVEYGRHLSPRGASA